MSLDGARDFCVGAGPPYITTVDDLRRLGDDYCEFVIAGRAAMMTGKKAEDDWMTEVHAHMASTASLGVKHTLLMDLGVTHPRYENDVDGIMHQHWDFMDVESLATRVPRAWWHLLWSAALLTDDEFSYPSASPNSWQK